MAVILETEDQLRQVLGDLKHLRPKSNVMENLIRNTLSGKYAWPGIEYVVDSYPGWNACICRRSIKNSDKYVYRVSRNSVSVFSKQADALQKLLNEKDVIDWKLPAHFIAVPKPEMYDVLRAKCEEINPIRNLGCCENARVFLLKPDKIHNREMPSGPFRLGELRGPEHAELVQARWDFSNDDSRQYFHYLLSDKCHLPNSAIFDTDTNISIAQILYTGDGSIGIGWVHPDYRNKGFYQIVNYDLCQKIYRMGQSVAWAYVAEENKASTRCYRRMGGEECDYRVEWITSSPRVS